MRLLDIETCLVIGAIWAAAAHFTAAFDVFFAVSFFLAAFFLFMASSLTEKRGTGLITAATAGLLSIHTASIAGPSAYKLIFFVAVGLAFEAFYTAKKEGWPLLGALAATALAPTFLWALSGAPSPIGMLIDLTLMALLTGLAGCAAGLLIWNYAAQTKAVIKFQCYGATGELRKLIRKKRPRKRFY